ncbi:MAG: GTPase KRas protein [Candidatus Thorarchaeota archaeon]|nr:MAG: GTPase KRas protein [Candidatus Thorarchaeota archaeon]
MSPSYLYKIATVGPQAVGKTSLILRYTTGVFRDYYAPTLGADFAVKKLNFDDTKVKLQVWDLGSQDFLGGVRKNFYAGAKGVVFVFDVTRPITLERLQDWKREVDTHLRGYKALVVANKTDLIERRKITTEEGKALAEEFRGEYLETSVKLNQHVDETFLTITKMIME